MFIASGYSYSDAFFIMYRLLLILFFIKICLIFYSQPIEVMSGLMKIPSSEMQANGSFSMGGNYLPACVGVIWKKSLSCRAFVLSELSAKSHYQPDPDGVIWKSH